MRAAFDAKADKWLSAPGTAQYAFLSPSKFNPQGRAGWTLHAKGHSCNERYRQIFVSTGFAASPPIASSVVNTLAGLFSLPRYPAPLGAC